MFITKAEAEFFCNQLPKTVTAFMKCVDLAPNGCWIWNRGKTSSRYGLISKKGHMYAHRWSWDFFKGPNNGFCDDGQLVCHDCPGGDNPSCVNPNHLFLGTNRDNSKDASKKGSFKQHHKNFGKVRKGNELPHSKLTEDQVREIRRLKKEEGLGITRIRRKFGLSHGTVQNVLNGKSWRHIL